MLQESATKLSEKMEIIGLNLLSVKKFKKQCEKQIQELEGKSDKYVHIDYFRKEHINYEERIREYVMTQMSQLQNEIQSHKVDLSE